MQRVDGGASGHRRKQSQTDDRTQSERERERASGADESTDETDQRRSVCSGAATGCGESDVVFKLPLDVRMKRGPLFISETIHQTPRKGKNRVNIKLNRKNMAQWAEIGGSNDADKVKAGRTGEA